MVIRRVEAMYHEFMTHHKPQVTAKELAKEILRYSKFAGITPQAVHQQLSAKGKTKAQSHH